MTFLAARWLWLLAVVAVLAAAYVVSQARRHRAAARFTNLELLASVAPTRPGWRRHVAAVGLLAGLATSAIGLARPVEEVRVPRDRATIVLALDVSLSMVARDVAPDRFQAAQAAAAGFVDEVPEAYDVGLVAFAGTARVVVPPADDRVALVRAIQDLELAEGTAIGEAVFASLDAVRMVPAGEDGEPPPAHVLLLSDGETNQGRPNRVAARAAEEAGVPVSTIAFGTAEGVAMIPDSRSGEGVVPVPVPVDADALADIAGITGGRAFTAESRGELTEVYTNLGTTVGTEVEQREVWSWFVGLSIALLVATSGSSLVWARRLP